MNFHASLIIRLSTTPTAVQTRALCHLESIAGAARPPHGKRAALPHRTLSKQREAGTAPARAATKATKLGRVDSLTMSKEPEPEGKTDESKDPETDPNDLSPADVKIILLGDSAVGKTKLVERFLMDEYNPQQLSTYALTMFRKNLDIDGKNVKVDIWDTAGQERFNKMHPAYYHRAHACILCFDVTRKATYQHLGAWYDEMRDACENIPCILVANKIDIDYQVTKKNFKFASSKNIPFYFVSAADGTNVVKVFRAAVESALDYKDNSGDFMNEAYKLLDDA